MLDPGDLGFRVFQVFVAVLETGSINAAATRLGLSPSTVSQQVTNFEAQAGTALFDRSTRPIVPTVAGAIIKPHAYRVLEAVRMARADLMRLNLSSLTEIRLGVIDDLDASITPELVHHLRGVYPGCLFPAVSRRSDSLKTMLEAREVDIIVSAMGPDDPNVFEAWPVVNEGFFIAAARGVLPDTLTMADLKTVPFVHYNRSLPIGRRIAQHLARLRLALDEQYSFEAYRSVLAATERMRAWTITSPLSLLDTERFRGRLDLRPLPFAGFTRTVQLFARRGELGGLPGQLAVLCRKLIREQLVPRLKDEIPFGEPIFHSPDDEEDALIAEKGVRPAGDGAAAG